MRVKPRPRTLLSAAFAALALAACGPDGAEPPSAPSTAAEAPASRPSAPEGPRPVATAAAAAPAAAAPADPFVLVVLGDSLAAGETLSSDAALTAQLARELARQGVRAELRDASVAGDDAAKGLARFETAVPADADGVLVELGAVDLAAGAPPDAVEASLSAIIERAQARGLWVGLIGLSAPDPADADYAADFKALYGGLARDHGVALYPDFYAGLVDRETGMTRPELFLEDGVHPTDLGAAIVADGVADWLADTLPQEARRGG